MSAAIVDPCTDARWGELLASSPQACVFHHPAWLSLLRECYGYEIAAWALEGRDGTLAAGLPVARIASRLTGTRLVALPFSDVCPPLGAPETAAALGAAVAERREHEGLDLEVRARLTGIRGGHAPVRYVEHRLPLEPDVEAVAERFSKSQVKRGIAKARREGVTVERRTDADALARFYRMHVRTRRSQGVPTQPRRFILGFADLFARGRGFVLLARAGGEDLAAAVFLAAGGTLTYKYGASDPRFLAKRPNNLLFMEAIRWGCENGQRELDFGRTDLENDGLRRFKSAWGAQERELAYTYLGTVPGDGAGRARRLTGAVIRRSPPAVGRWVGELFYRHAG